MKKTRFDGPESCDFIRSHLISIVENDISSATFLRIRNHLDSCTDCASLVRRFSEAWENPGPVAHTRLSPSFFPRIIERIEAEEEVRSRPRGVLAAAGRVLRPAALAAVFLGGIWAGFEMGKAGKKLSPAEVSFTDRFFESFESIPPGSVADYYVSRLTSKKEDSE